MCVVFRLRFSFLFAIHFELQLDLFELFRRMNGALFIILATRRGTVDCFSLRHSLPFDWRSSCLDDIEPQSLSGWDTLLPILLLVRTSKPAAPSSVALDSDAAIWYRPHSGTAWPFSNSLNTWHRKNPQDAAFMIPWIDVWEGRPELGPEDFDTQNLEHVKQISYGKVLLLYRIRFQSPLTGYDKVHNL